MPVSEILTPPAPVLEELDALYPLETDEPLATSRKHYGAMVYAKSAVAHQLRHAECLVAADYAFYYQRVAPGHPGPGPSVTPDVMVVLDYTAPYDRSYRLWEAGKVPDLVMEMSSESTHRQDQLHKHGLYARLGIQEYWMYDPHGDILDPLLQGFSLEEGRYRPIGGELRPDLGAEIFLSAVLGTFWGRLLDTDELRLWIGEQDAWFPPRSESDEERERQTRRAARETERADSEAERADIEAERADIEARRADIEARRADRVSQQLESESRRADSEATERARLEEEIRRLRAQLRAE